MHLTLTLTDMLTDAITIVTQLFTFVSSNTMLQLLIGGAIGIALVGGIISLFVGRSR